MILITARVAALKMSGTKIVNVLKKKRTGNNLVALQMSLGYEFFHKAKSKRALEIYSHFH